MLPPNPFSVHSRFINTTSLYKYMLSIPIYRLHTSTFTYYSETTSHCEYPRDANIYFVTTKSLSHMYPLHYEKKSETWIPSNVNDFSPVPTHISKVSLHVFIEMQYGHLLIVILTSFLFILIHYASYILLHEYLYQFTVYTSF